MKTVILLLLIMLSGCAHGIYKPRPISIRGDYTFCQVKTPQNEIKETMKSLEEDENEDK